jgi:hypothetical protein
MKTETAKLTSAQYYNVHKKDIQQRVMKILGWDELTYCNYVYEQGIAFLYSYLDKDGAYARILEEHHIFWNWWKNQWSIRDEDFIYSHNNLLKAHIEPLYYYKMMNGGRNLLSPHNKYNAVLERSYGGMINALIKYEQTVKA